jgi:hypothetical protein
MIHKYAAARGWLKRTGLTLLTATTLALALVAVGVVSIESLALGAQSGFRTLAEFAVLGCLLAAVGYWNE